MNHITRDARRKIETRRKYASFVVHAACGARARVYIRGENGFLKPLRAVEIASSRVISHRRIPERSRREDPRILG